MPRTIRDTKLESRESRKKLKASGKPYWRLIDAGLHFGYRKGKTGGSWVVRWYLGAQKYIVETVGNADDGALDADGVDVLSFTQAQTKAREIAAARKVAAAAVEAPAPSAPYKVSDCIEDYLTWMDDNAKSASDSRYRAKSLILPKLGSKVCEQLTAEDIQKWLEALAKSAPRLRTKEGEVQRFKEASAEPEDKRRRRASANRTLTILKAALNRAWRAGKIPSDNAWRRVEPFGEADAARIRYLTIDEARRLINASDPDFRMMVRAALATGARYGELTALEVSDFNRDSGTLHVRTSKSGHGRHIVLADEGLALFKSLAAGRPGGAPMLTKPDGGPWLKSHQARPMTDACATARIKPAANFHALRHTYASHAIMNGAPLLVVAKNLGHSDTRMVEKHYGHMAPSYIADAIRAAAPRFGEVEETSVVQLRSPT